MVGPQRVKTNKTTKNYTSVERRATDMSPDRSCSRTSDPDIALCSSSEPDGTWLQVEAQATQISMALVAAQASDFNTDPSFSRITDPDMVLSSSRAWMSPLLLVAVQATQIGMAPQAAQPLDTNMAQGGSLDLEYSHGLRQ